MVLTTLNLFYDRVSGSKEKSRFPSTLTCCPDHQRKFLLKTATPQQIHALVQIIYNLLTENITISEEGRRKVITYKDALVNLAEPNIP